MILKQRLAISVWWLMIASLACNLPLPDATPTSEPSAPSTTESTLPTAETTDQATQVSDSESMSERLKAALISEDYEVLKSLMGDAFLVQFTGGEGGLIAVDDAINLLRSDLLSGSDAIIFNAAIDLAEALGAPIEDTGLTITQSLVSTGWGAQNEDHAIVLIGKDEADSDYFAGIIYARRGFEGMQPTATASVSPTAAEGTPDAASADPAPRGTVQYESDFLQGWPIFDDEHVTSLHTGEGYLLSVAGTWGGWAFTSLVDVAAFYAEIAVEPQNCPPAQGSYGLIFNHKDSDEFIVFVIECNGTFTLWERTATARSATLLTGALPEDIEAGTGEHRLGVLTEGSSLALYIDDVRLGVVSRAVGGGDFGPYVETSGSATMSALFTNLAVFDTE